MSDKVRRTIRTAFQMLVAAAALIPVLVPTLHLPAGKVATAAGALVAGAAIVTHLVSNPTVENILPGWLKATAPVANAEQPEGEV